MLKDAALKIYEAVRLRSMPVGVKFLKDQAFPEKTRKPSDRNMKITICQAVSWARIYGWKVAIGFEDNICLPAAVAFGLCDVGDQKKVLSDIMVEVGWLKRENADKAEWFTVSGYKYLLFEPVSKMEGEADVVLFFGNAAQMARIVQAKGYVDAKPVMGRFGGRVACSEYLIAPFILGEAVLSVPGAGDRIFAYVQEDELVVGMPSGLVQSVAEAIVEAGAKIGTNRYPFTPYMLHQVQFPKIYQELAKRLGVI